MSEHSLTFAWRPRDIVTTRRLSRSKRKDQIARIAARLFAKKGFAGTTVKAIADRARVSEAMIFKLFGSKDGLYRHIIENRELTALRDRFYAQLHALVEANDDEGVFQGAKAIEGISCVSPVQAYLDLHAMPERAEEAAEHLRKERLQWQ